VYIIFMIIAHDFDEDMTLWFLGDGIGAGIFLGGAFGREARC
jgi:hypothetical protein